MRWIDLDAVDDNALLTDANIRAKVEAELIASKERDEKEAIIANEQKEHLLNDVSGHERTHFEAL
jgi:hypothetical protein